MLRTSAYVSTALAALILCLPAELAAAEPTADAEAQFRAAVTALAKKLKGAGVKRVAVLEFADASGKEAQLGGTIGAGGKYLAEVTETVFVSVKDPSYDVIDKQRCAQVMKEIEFQVQALGDKDMLSRFGGAQPVDALVTGSVQRVEDKLKITVKAVAVPEATSKGMEMLILPMDPDWAALFGESFYLPPAVGKRAEAIKKMAPAEAEALVTKQAVDLVVKGEESHPLADAFSGVPYQMGIYVDGKPLPFHKQGRALFVPAALGKPYRIRLANRSDRAAAVALYVDGLNTIGGTRELPSKGLKWVLKPDMEASIKGWQKGTAIAREFVFCKAAESLAARKNYLDEVGLITAVFFREKGSDSSVTETTRGLTGTGEGKTVDSKVKRVTLEYEKVPAAVLSIHYDVPTAVQKLEIVP